MKQIRHLIILLMCCQTLQSIAQSSEEYFRLMAEADSSIVAMRFSQADSLLTCALRLEPANPSNYLILSNLGMVRHYMGRDSAAIATLNMAHDIAPRSVTVLTNRARVWRDMGRRAEAEADYNRIIGLDSMAVEPRFYRAMLTMARGEVVQAEADISRIERIAPEAKLSLLGRAVINTAKGDAEAAIVGYTRLITRYPEAEYHKMRASLYLQQGKLQDASDDIAFAIEQMPDDWELFLMRASLNMARYRTDDAKADAKRAVQLGADPALAKQILRQ